MYTYVRVHVRRRCDGPTASWSDGAQRPGPAFTRIAIFVPLFVRRGASHENDEPPRFVDARPRWTQHPFRSEATCSCVVLTTRFGTFPTFLRIAISARTSCVNVGPSYRIERSSLFSEFAPSIYRDFRESNRKRWSRRTRASVLRHPRVAAPLSAKTQDTRISPPPLPPPNFVRVSYFAHGYPWERRREMTNRESVSHRNLVKRVDESRGGGPRIGYVLLEG